MPDEADLTEPESDFDDLAVNGADMALLLSIFSQVPDTLSEHNGFVFVAGALEALVWLTWTAEDKKNLLIN